MPTGQRREGMRKCDKKTRISICMGSACYPRGNDDNLDLIRHYLKVHNLEGSVEIVGHRCQDNCHLGPNLSVDDVPHHEVNPAVLPALLKRILPVFHRDEPHKAKRHETPEKKRSS